MSADTPQGSDLLADALRVATRTVATAQALSELGADVVRQAVSSGRPNPVGAGPEHAAVPALPAGGPVDSVCADEAALDELRAYLSERPYWSALDAQGRWLRLGMLIGWVAAQARHSLAGYELVGLAYHVEHTDEPPSASTG